MTDLRTPAPQPLLGHILAERWHQDNLDEGEKPTAHGTRLRHSDAGSCLRYLAYTATGAEPTDPPGVVDAWNWRLGQIIHERWQAELEARWPHAEVEVRVRPSSEFDASGHVDARIVDGPVPGITVVEGKSAGGYGFKRMVGVKGQGLPGRPEGPRWSALVQGAVNAWCADADLLVIVVWAKEAVSESVAARNRLPEWMRIMAEWHYTPEQFRPIAERELLRWQFVLDEVAAGRADEVPRVVPDWEGEYEIVDPAPKGPQSKGKAVWPSSGRRWDSWVCQYCRFQSRCKADA